MFKFSQSSIKRLNTIHPSLKLIMEESLKVSPIDFGIPADGGKRTAERQNELFKQGVSKCDGYVNKSNHQTGNAVDVYAYVDGAASWDKKHLTLLAGTILSTANRLIQEGKIDISIEWGGNWTTFIDMPHYEIK